MKEMKKENKKDKMKIDFTKIYDFNSMTLAEMQDFIEKNHPEDKEEFKKHAIEYVKLKNIPGLRPVYNHFKARKYFCEKYMPELLPKKKAKKSDSILNW